MTTILKHLTILTALLFISAVTSFSQEVFTLKGNVIDEQFELVVRKNTKTAS